MHGVQQGGRAVGVSPGSVAELLGCAVTGSSLDRSGRTGGNLAARHVGGGQLRAGGAIRVDARRIVSELEAGSPVEGPEPLAVRPFEGQPVTVRRAY